jgi:hypothetical protein
MNISFKDDVTVILLLEDSFTHLLQECVYFPYTCTVHTVGIIGGAYEKFMSSRGSYS